MQTQLTQPKLSPAFERGRNYIFQVDEILLSEMPDSEKVAVIQQLPLPKTTINNARVIHLIANNLSYRSEVYTRSQAHLFEQDFEPVYAAALRDIRTIINDFENLVWYDYEHYFEAGYAQGFQGEPWLEERTVVNMTNHEDLEPDSKIMADAKKWRKLLPDTISEADGRAKFKFWYIKAHRRVTMFGHTVIDEEIGQFTDRTLAEELQKSGGRKKPAAV